MRKAWSFLWFVVVACIALVIILSAIEPYVWLIMLILVLTAIAWLSVKAYRLFSGRRGHF